MLSITYTGPEITVDQDALAAAYEATGGDLMTPEVWSSDQEHPAEKVADVWDWARQSGAIAVPDDIHVACYACDDDAGSGVIIVVDPIIGGVRQTVGITDGWAEVADFADEEVDSDTFEAVLICVGQVVAVANSTLMCDRPPHGDPVIERDGVTVILTHSAGSDGAPLVIIDTDDELMADGHEDPAIRVLLNDATVYAGVEYEPTDEEN